jgi:polysaccharide deacetylase family protein (PEP-CTERM system associated)
MSDQPSQTRPAWFFTVDVEDYYHIEAARHVYFQDRWGQFPTHVEPNTQKLLDLCDKHAIRGTFFILGHVAKRKHHLAKRIADAGHEIACHGTMHDRIHRLGPRRFRDDVEYTKKMLEDQTGTRVIGYRAPTFSLVRDTAWAIDELLAMGFEYDASVFPVWHPQYGVSDAPLSPFMLRRHDQSPAILELPPLVWRVFGRRVGVAGGGYFRQFPLAAMKAGMAQARREARPVVLYFHPWEFDPDMPRVSMGWKARWRTYTGLKRALARLDELLQWTQGRDATWSRLDAALPTLRELAASIPPYTLAPGRAPVAEGELVEVTSAR